jgi:pimeloyl-ACP methyl ester carboxylesterase
MSTANVACDMDLLRRGVGDAKLTYWGISYGFYLGWTYANLFPGKVRAQVVDGVLDPIAWSTGRGDQARILPFSTLVHGA